VNQLYNTVAQLGPGLDWIYNDKNYNFLLGNVYHCLLLTMASTPPGISYLVKRLPSFAIPPATIYAIGVLLRRSHIEYPSWTLWLAGVLSLPVASALSLLSQRLHDYYDAINVGAAMAPLITDGTPGNLLFLLRAGKNSEGYVGV
jgi:hypothetical protein